jgi:hypothetical protein
MGCNNWEKGSIKIPTSEFSKLAKDLASLMVNRHEELFNKAIETYNKIKIDKLDFSIERKLQDLLSSNSVFYGSQSPQYSYQEIDQIKSSICKDNKLMKPKKKDFKVKDKTKFYDCELSVRLDRKTKTLYWDVSDNNRAVESAHECFLGRNTLKLLNGVKFSNRTGGVFEGSDEYRDDEGEGKHVTARYGKFADPKRMKKEYLFEAKMSLQKAKYFK